MGKRSHVVTMDVCEAMWEAMDILTETQGLGKSDLLRTGIWRMHDWAHVDETGFVAALRNHIERKGTKYMLWLSGETKGALQTCIDISESLGVDTTQSRILSFMWEMTIREGVYKPAVVDAAKHETTRAKKQT